MCILAAQVKVLYVYWTSNMNFIYIFLNAENSLLKYLNAYKMCPLALECI